MRQAALIPSLPAQLWTPEPAYSARQSISQLAECAGKILDKALEQIGGKLDGGLEAEACEVVAVEEGLGVVEAAGEVLKVDGSEGVGCAGLIDREGRSELFVLEGVKGGWG